MSKSRRHEKKRKARTAAKRRVRFALNKTDVAGQAPMLGRAASRGYGLGIPDGAKED